MAFLEINPRYQHVLHEQGLDAPASFLGMPSIIICGHPDRNVARVTLGTGSDVVPGYLKREHSIPWKERLRNALAGFGFVSKSSREASILRSLQQAGIGCPDWIAVGEDNRGRAFLLLRELSDTIELRRFLQNHQRAPAGQRRRFARKLGEALAGFHNAGFDHPDLYSKHVFVHPEDLAVSFLDWQRSRRRGLVSWRRRCRDLAALEATLADDLATVRDRLICLRAYLRQSHADGSKWKHAVYSTAHSIGRLAARLLGQRRIRELRRVPAPNHAPGVIWKDGESLCLTAEFQAELDGRIPDWLRLARLPARRGDWEDRTWVDLRGSRPALLIRRRGSRLLGGLWAWLRRRRPASPEVRRAGQMLRLERYGIRTWRLLAFGQRSVSGQSVESFLLVQPPLGSVGLGAWLAHPCTALGTRRRLIREAAGMLRRIHDLHYYFGGQPCFAVVQADQTIPEHVVLASIDGLRSRRRPSNGEALSDLAALHRELRSEGYGRTDQLRLLSGYLGLRKRSGACKRLARALLMRRGSAPAVVVRAWPASLGSFRLRPAKQGALP